MTPRPTWTGRHCSTFRHGGEGTLLNVPVLFPEEGRGNIFQDRLLLPPEDSGSRPVDMTGLRGGDEVLEFQPET